MAADGGGGVEDVGGVFAGEAVEVGGHAEQGVAAAPVAVHFGAYGVEVDEPELEEGAGRLLEGLVHAAVEFGLVVECAEDVGDGALIGEGR